MKKEVSVKKAVLIGQLCIDLPIFIIIIGFPFLSVYLVSIDVIPVWGIVVGFIIGFGFAWLYWSFTITKWRIWAFENVRNVHELKRKAIENSLIWKNDNFWGNTEIKTFSDQQKLKQLDKRFEKEDVFKEGYSLPKKTEIFLSKTDLLVEFFSLLLVAGVGIFLLSISKWNSINKSLVLGLISLFIGVYNLFKLFKKTNIREPLIIIDDKGIATKTDFKSWNNIVNEQVVKEGIGNSSKTFLIYFYKTKFQNATERYGKDNSETFYEDLDLEYEKVKIDQLNVSRKQMENIIRTYRIRYQKNN